MPAARSTKKRITNAAGQALDAKLKGAGSPVKLKHLKAKTVTANDMGKNRNGAFTSNGSLNQGYDKEQKKFTKASGRSARGRLAAEGSSNANSGRTHSMSYYDENGNRKSGRGGQLASRRQRYYDVRVGLGLAGG